MVDEKPNKYQPRESLPIPTYDEATSSRPPSSHAFLGPSEISQDAERQGLLHRSETSSQTRNGFIPPTVESTRSSLDFLPSSGENSVRNSHEELRREMEEMDVIDPERQDQSQLGARFSKHISSISDRLSFIHVPLRKWLPSWASIKESLYIILKMLQPGWILVGRAFVLVLVVFLVYLVFVSDIFSLRQRSAVIGKYDPETIRIFVQRNINGSAIRENLEHLTKFDHIAGTRGNYALAKWVKATFDEATLDAVEMERFDVYLNYPTKDGRRVAIIDPPELAWEAKLEEEAAYSDPPRQQTLVFHGHSKAGDVSGPLVYANYGAREDFRKLQDQGISLNGSIALVRYYGLQGDRALKVKAAELAGAVGCLIYSDPSDDGFVKGKPFPEGRYMPEDGVQRGAVSLMSWVIGDVLSPGFASTPEEPRRTSQNNNPGLNNIPSLPLAWRDAKILLQSLKGHGQKLAPDSGWIGGVPDVEWWTGDQHSPKVNLKNQQDEVERQPIYNVLGKIEGMEQGKKSVILGNHRDAWCFGAVDPGSGTAVFLELVRVFGQLKRLGWRPLRTIEFASWDGEEYNLIGSTEHVEKRLDVLRDSGIAYLNVDVAVQGKDFQASGSPLLGKALRRVMSRVSSPKDRKTLRGIWEEKDESLGALGAGSDYVAFQDLAGTSSLDMSFAGSGHDFPYHSCYDNFRWMTEQGDPSFEFHVALGQVWALMALELADEVLIPFDLDAYASKVKDYVRDLGAYAQSKGPPRENFDLTDLIAASQVFEAKAKEFHAWEDAWEAEIKRNGGFEGRALMEKRFLQNERMVAFESDLLDLTEGGGLPGRTQFKHILYAPQAWSGYDDAIFPGIRDAIDEGNWQVAKDQVVTVSNILRKASEDLVR